MSDYSELWSVLPGVTYMDPPDGGATSLLTQFQRMAKDAARYRWLRNRTYKDGGRLCCEGPDVDEMAFGFAGDGLDIAIDAAMKDAP